MSSNGEIKFLTHEVGSLAKPSWLVKTSAGKPLEESDIEHAQAWGDKLEVMAEAGPGDFIYVPPYVPHPEINANDDEPLSCVLVRSGQEPVVVNLDIPVVEKPEEVHWVDNIHPAPKT